MFNLIYKWTDKIKAKVAELSDRLGEKGQGMVEYAMILAAVAVVAVLVLWNNDTGLKKSVTEAFGAATTQITNANTKATAAGNGQ